MSHYHSHCCSMPHGHGDHHWGHQAGCAGVYLYYVPMPYPVMPSMHDSHSPQVMPQELTADPAASGDAMLGGFTTAHLTLETYVEAGAAAPEVKVTVVKDGTSTTTTSSGLPEGYQMDEDFLTLDPGAKITLEVVDAVARLRWCETVCC